MTEEYTDQKILLNAVYTENFKKVYGEFLSAANGIIADNIYIIDPKTVLSGSNEKAQELQVQLKSSFGSLVNRLAGEYAEASNSEIREKFEQIKELGTASSTRRVEILEGFGVSKEEATQINELARLSPNLFKVFSGIDVDAIIEKRDLLNTKYKPSQETTTTTTEEASTNGTKETEQQQTRTKPAEKATEAEGEPVAILAENEEEEELIYQLVDDPTKDIEVVNQANLDDEPKNIISVLVNLLKTFLGIDLGGGGEQGQGGSLLSSIFGGGKQQAAEQETTPQQDSPQVEPQVVAQRTQEAANSNEREGSEQQAEQEETASVEVRTPSKKDYQEVDEVLANIEGDGAIVYSDTALERTNIRGA